MVVVVVVVVVVAVVMVMVVVVVVVCVRRGGGTRPVDVGHTSSPPGLPPALLSAAATLLPATRYPLPNLLTSSSVRRFSSRHCSTATANSLRQFEFPIWRSPSLTSRPNWREAAAT